MEAALVTAVRRGVRVAVLLPGPLNWALVRAASRAGFGPLLEAGIELHEYAPDGLRDTFTREGLDTVTEFSGRAAGAAARRRIFDVVILDKAMPDLNGLDLLGECQRLPDARLILLTAFGGSLVAGAARRRGADGYLDKPVRPGELVATVRAVLAASRRVS
jgi:two-component system, OmpR family, phosphate regulon response regulator PhoB